MASSKQTRAFLAATALLAPTAVVARYAQFSNDDKWSEGCGQSVDVNNPGCLTQYGQRSIKFHDANDQEISLIASPGATCDCQNYCEEHIVNAWYHFQGDGPGCFKLRDEEAQSFRFILGSCLADQC